MSRVCESFPWDSLPDVGCVFVYGSSVLPSKSPKGKTETQSEPSMLDLVCVLNNPLGNHDSTSMLEMVAEWHRVNRKKNPSHYPCYLRLLRPSSCAYVQQKIWPRFYTNTLATLNGVFCKYIVTSVDHLTRDLTDWDALYLAGRLQKPVIALSKNDTSVYELLSPSLSANRVNAVRWALLCLPERFSFLQFLNTIVGMTYLGDIRNGIAEQPDKVEGLVKHNTLLLANTYLPLLSDDENPVKLHLTGGRTESELRRLLAMCHTEQLPYSFDFVAHGGRINDHLCSFSPLLHNVEKEIANLVIVQDVKESVRAHQFRLLPANMKSKSTDIAFLRRESPWAPSVLREATLKIVRRSSIRATLKNGITAGLWKSMAYSLRKMRRVVKVRE